MRNFFCVLGSSIFLLSCSTNYYQEPQGAELATISFSNLSTNTPVIHVVSDCASLRLQDELIERKKPNEIPKHTTKIKAESEVTIQYSYLWIGNETMELVTKSTQYHQSMERKTTKHAGSCDGEITFIPQKNRHYEILLKNNMEKCQGRITEAVRTSASPQQKLYKMNTIPSSSCNSKTQNNG